MQDSRNLGQQERILRLPEVMHRSGKGRSMLYLDMAQGRFPQPVRLGARAVGWLESEIQAWIATRVAISRPASRQENRMGPDGNKGEREGGVRDDLG